MIDIHTARYYMDLREAIFTNPISLIAYRTKYRWHWTPDQKSKVNRSRVSKPNVDMRLRVCIDCNHNTWLLETGPCNCLCHVPATDIE